MAEEYSAAEAFVEQLKAAFGEDLRSAVLYGSAARGEFRSGSSDLNLLVLVTSLGVDQLARAAGPVRAWIEAGNPPPMMLEEREWRNSADVFAVEYSDIRGAHRLLAGVDPFEGLAIRREHLRLQLEHEIRSRKIQLREGYLVAAGNPDQLGRLLVGAISTFLTYFRAMHRLADRPVPGDDAQLLQSTAELVGFDATPMVQVLEAKRAGKAPPTAIRGELATGYLAVVEKATRWLDAYEPVEGISPDL